MTWPFKKTETEDCNTPDGRPLSEYQAYWFRPQTDITAYELALIMQMYSSCGNTEYFNMRDDPLYARKDFKDFAWTKEWAVVSRHFKKVEP